MSLNGKPIKCQDILESIEAFAPRGLAMEGDPVGLQLGDPQQPVSKLFLSLELDSRVLEEALNFGAQMLVLHHTPFFKPFQHLREDQPHDRVVLHLIREGLALYTAHTNLDCVRGGVNDVLAGLLGLATTEILEPLNQPVPSAGLGRIGNLNQAVTLGALVSRTAHQLRTENLRFVGSPTTLVTRVACCGGTGAFLMNQAAQKGAEVFVTADVKHHEAQQALELGLCLIDGGHFATENPVMVALAQYLQERLPTLQMKVSSISTDPFRTWAT